MKKILLMTAFCSTLLLAEGGKFYVEVAGGLLTHEKEDNGLKSDLDSTALKVTLGSLLMEQKNYHLSLEGSLMLGLDGESKSSIEQNNGNTLTNAKLYLDKLYNVYVKGTFPLSNELKLNGYLGLSHAKTLAKADNYNGSNGFKTSLSYGIGMDYEFYSNVYLHTNYMQYFSDLSAFEAGMGFRF